MGSSSWSSHIEEEPVSNVSIIEGCDWSFFTHQRRVSSDWDSKTQEPQTKEGSRRSRHISSHKHQLCFIRGRKGHWKQHQRRLPVTRSPLSVLHIPESYLGCCVDRELYALWVFGDLKHPLLHKSLFVLETSPFPSSVLLCDGRHSHWWLI